MYSRAGHWLAQSVAMVLSSKSTSILYLLSPPETHLFGFPYYRMACCLGVRKMKNTGEYTVQANRRLLLPVICYCYYWQYILCQCPKPNIYLTQKPRFNRIVCAVRCTIQWAGHTMQRVIVTFYDLLLQHLHQPWVSINSVVPW